jgi:hypothetical protein
LFEAVPKVVFGDKVGSAGVEAACKEAGQDEIDKGTIAEDLNEKDVDSELGEKIVQVPLCENLNSYESGSESIKEYLKRSIHWGLASLMNW